MARVNKSKVNLGTLTEWIKAMDRKISIKVGIIGEQATQIHEGTGLTNAELGAVHEFGATINHPGGTPYFIKEDGTAQFVSKDKGEKLPKTKPHQITIPARSFLREPILGKDGKKEIIKVVESQISKQFKATELSPGTANKIIDDTAELIATAAYLRVIKAFENNTIQPPTTTASKKKRKYNPNNPTLVDSGQLKKSISYEVKEIK